MGLSQSATSSTLGSWGTGEGGWPVLTCIPSCSKKGTHSAEVAPEEHPAPCSEGLRAGQGPHRPLAGPVTTHPWTQEPTGSNLGSRCPGAGVGVEESSVEERGTEDAGPVLVTQQGQKMGHQGACVGLHGQRLLPEAGRASQDVTAWETGSATLLVSPGGGHETSRHRCWSAAATGLGEDFYRDLGEGGSKQHCEKRGVKLRSRQAQRP